MATRYFLVTFSDGQEAIVRTKKQNGLVFMEEKSKIGNHWFHWDRTFERFLKLENMKHEEITKEVADIIISQYEIKNS